MGNDQFEFRRGIGTRNALCSPTILMQKSPERGSYACFGVYEQAFIKVEHSTLLKCLEWKGVGTIEIKTYSGNSQP